MSNNKTSSFTQSEFDADLSRDKYRYLKSIEGRLRAIYNINVDIDFVDSFEPSKSALKNLEDTCYLGSREQVYVEKGYEEYLEYDVKEDISNIAKTTDVLLINYNNDFKFNFTDDVLIQAMRNAYDRDDPTIKLDRVPVYPDEYFSVEFEKIEDDKGYKNFKSEHREFECKTKEDGDIVMGRFERYLVERSLIDPEDRLWYGRATHIRGDKVPEGIHLEDMYTHCGLFGKTGMGKSTLAKTLMTQMIYSGNGFTYIDPKGNDSYELIQNIPEHRIEDVIHIQPSLSSAEDNIIGFNALNLPVSKDHPEYDDYLESQVSFVLEILDAKGYKRITPVMRNLVKNMIEFEGEYTLLDLYQLIHSDNFEEFTEKARKNSVITAKYTEKIWEMKKNDELEEIERRLDNLASTKTTREFFSIRDNELSMGDLIKDNKILIIDAQSNNNALRKILSISIVNQLWDNIRLFDEKIPHYIFFDEFQAVFRDDDSDTGRLGEIFSEARSARLSVTIASQSPKQIPRNLWESDITENVGEFLSLTLGKNSAPLLSDVYVDTRSDYLKTRLSKYTSIRLKEEGEEKRDVEVKNFPDYPPIHSREEVDDIISDSRERYGSSRVSEKEIVKNSEFNIDADELGIEMDESDSDTNSTNNIITKTLDSVYYTVLHKDASDIAGTYVAESTVKEVLHNLYDFEKEYEFSNILEQNTNYFTENRIDGEVCVTLTDEGVHKAEETDSGAGGSGGKSVHRLLLKDIRRLLPKYGIGVDVPSQGGETKPDGYGKIIEPLEPSVSTNNQIVSNTIEKLRDDDFVIEAEEKGKSKPFQPIRNLAKAYTDGDHCLYIVSDKDGARKLNNILKNPEGGSKKYDNGVIKTYNIGDKFKREPSNDVDKFPVRQADLSRNTNWITKNGEYYLVSSTAKGDIEEQLESPIAHFESYDELSKWSVDDFPAYRTYTNANGHQIYQNGTLIEQYEDKDEMESNWKDIKKPFIVEKEFGRSTIPTEGEHYTILVLPDNTDKPFIYRNGEKHYLDSENKTIKKESTSSNTENTKQNQENTEKKEESESQENDTNTPEKTELEFESDFL